MRLCKALSGYHEPCWALLIFESRPPLLLCESVPRSLLPHRNSILSLIELSVRSAWQPLPLITDNSILRRDTEVAPPVPSPSVLSPRRLAVSLATTGPYPPPPHLLNPPSAILSSAGGASENRPTFLVCHLHSHCLLITIRQWDEERHSNALANTTATFNKRVTDLEWHKGGKISTDTDLYSSLVSANVCVTYSCQHSTCWRAHEPTNPNVWNIAGGIILVKTEPGWAGR